VARVDEPVRYRTLHEAADVAGIGLFTGAPARARILPALAGTGIMLRRSDVPGSAPFAARVESLRPPPAGMPARNTILGPADGGPAGWVMTVEHLLSALAGLGVTDASIEVYGPELPMGDGSASMFVAAIGRAGLVVLDGGPEPLRIEREIVVEAGAGRVVARPRAEAGAVYRYELNYGPGAPIAPQAAEITLAPGPAGMTAYTREVVSARTFCLQAEAEQMRAMGLFKHLSPRDMLVIGADGPIDNELRFDDEPARHKLLDLIGDLALVGRPLQVEVVATRAGHALNHAMARELVRAGV
jgi:UDP-3-O-acyl N-acetylglucosamine deacetylase